MVQSHNSEIARLLDDAVTDIRNRGYTREGALSRAAEWFGVTVGRAKRMVYGEAYSVTEAERAAIRRRYLDHLDEQARYYEAKLDAAKARRRQMELFI